MLITAVALRSSRVGRSGVKLKFTLQTLPTKLPLSVCLNCLYLYVMAAAVSPNNDINPQNCELLEEGEPNKPVFSGDFDVSFINS